MDWNSVDIGKLENDIRYNEQQKSLCYFGTGSKDGVSRKVSEICTFLSLISIYEYDLVLFSKFKATVKYLIFIFNI